MKTTVIIPHHNDEVLLRQSLADFAEQKNPVQLVVIDDCSDTSECESIVEDFDLLFIRLPRNVGPAAACNTGLELVKTEFVAFHACDGYKRPVMFSTLEPHLATHPSVAFATGRCRWVDARTQLSWTSGTDVQLPTTFDPSAVIDLAKRRELSLASTATLYRTSMLRAFGGWPVSTRMFSDWLINAALAFTHGFVAHHETLATMNLRANSYFNRAEFGQRTAAAVAALAWVKARPELAAAFRETGLFGQLGFPALRSALSDRAFINGAFLRNLGWREAERMGSRVLPALLADFVLKNTKH